MPCRRKQQRVSERNLSAVSQLPRQSHRVAAVVHALPYTGLRARGRVERLPPDSIESWIVVPKLMAEEETGVGLEGDFSTAKARAERVRRVLKVLCARRLEMYPSPTQLSSLSARPSMSRPLNFFFPRSTTVEPQLCLFCLSPPMADRIHHVYTHVKPRFERE